MLLLQIQQTFQQWNNFENRLRFDEIILAIKGGAFFGTQCSFKRYMIYGDIRRGYRERMH